MAHRYRRIRRLGYTFISALLLFPLLVLTPMAASASPPASDKAPIAKSVRTALADDGRAPMVIEFEQTADLSAAASLDNWNRRGAAVVKALRTTARTSQHDVAADLQARGVAFDSYWVNNTIIVKGGTTKLANAAAADSNVKAIRSPEVVRLPKPTPAKAKAQVQSVEWGIANIKADQVWDTYGDRGEGIVVASIDSGVQYDHPALVEKYRGNLGGGEFDHSYNFFDPSQVCEGEEPCDLNGHGTHTMGTMVGGDGGENQIGVAPNATWIAAMGCESRTCSEAALSASAQWVLAPTDLNNENPDPAKRPNLVNNSWGGPGGDEWYRDYVTSWIAAGMFPVFSNGNEGSACETTGSPGDYVESYSVGNYDIDGNISSTSSRGAAPDGETKPNISAPGTNVRSSVPGDVYDSYSGTSMAAPHLSGSVALLWSAAPALVGDIDATRALLDDTARDKADDQCGGTEDDNNVYGEGQLDALALIDQAPVGEAGTLTGTVTDGASGDPLADATVSASDDSSTRTVTTDDDGTYSIRLSEGTYNVSASLFGYGTSELSDVAIVGGETTTTDIALDPAESASLSGTVRDDSGHGWPLYAKLSVKDTPVTAYSNPETGRYDLDLPKGGTYTVEVDPVLDGYPNLTEELTIGDDTAHQFAMKVDPACTAPGYEPAYDGLHETFDDPAGPDGWTVTSAVEDGATWAFDDPGGRGNLTGGEDGFAIVDSDLAGSGTSQDTTLTSPAIDLSGHENPVLSFATDFYQLGDDNVADVEVSVDGGQTWSNVWSKAEPVRGPDTELVELPDAAGKSAVQVRFHYVGSYDWWWQVDDVLVGTARCEPVRGGLVLGNVTNTFDGKPVNDATVTSDDAPTDTATTVATPDDDQVADGFYYLFSSVTGSHPFTATSGEYAPSTSTVKVQPDYTRRADFALGAGHLSVTPKQLKGSARLGTSVKRKLKLTNDGDQPVKYELTERDNGFEILGVDGDRDTKREIAVMRGAPLRRVPADVSKLANGASKRTGTAAGVHDEPWLDLPNLPTTLMDNVAGYQDGKVYTFGGTPDGTGAVADSYVYDPTAKSWDSIAPMPQARQMPASAFIGGNYVVTGGWGEGGDPVADTAIYDPSTDSWSQGAPNPDPWAASGTAVLDGVLYAVGGCADTCGSSTVMAYDAAADSWTQLPDYPESTAWIACGGVAGKVICAGGTSSSSESTSTYAYSPSTKEWTRQADLPADMWASSYAAVGGQLIVSGGAVQGSSAITNESYAYQPDTDEWVTMPRSNNALYRGAGTCGFFKIGGSLGNFDSTDLAEELPGYTDCGKPADVGWLKEKPRQGTVAAGESVTVTVTLDADQVTQPGTYRANLGIVENTPFTVAPAKVRLTATPPPSWGKLLGVVRTKPCEGKGGPLVGATVDISRGQRSWTFTTGDDGKYALWLKAPKKALEVIAAKDGFRPKHRSVRVRAGKRTTANFRLPQRGC
ncbi:S8 family serine peptidase [Nocardioidaceae bacterium SCSIO 66511]|nr:S8 family serine peptidase [Nocardioidaceae bacterium SCSIO 66511]